jgi:ribosomal protein L24
MISLKQFFITMAITFGMYVQVSSGFYKGCTGIVTEYYSNTGEYTVDMRCKMANGRVYEKQATFQASELKEIK